MPKPLPLNDFRARRYVLTDDDFGLIRSGAKQEINLIDEETWHDLMDLTSDVSIRTSSFHGDKIKIMSKITNLIIKELPDINSPIGIATYNAYDELSSTIFVVMHGYYRTAYSALRGALEYAVSGICEQLIVRPRTTKRMSFNDCCSKAQKLPICRAIDDNLLTQHNKSLFAQKGSDTRAGWFRCCYNQLSEYAHGRDASSHSNIWESNGPIYSEKAFEAVYNAFAEVAVLIGLAIAVATGATGISNELAGLLKNDKLTWFPSVHAVTAVIDVHGNAYR